MSYVKIDKIVKVRSIHLLIFKNNFTFIISENKSANLNRATNACESFHSHLENSFYKSHPNVDIFSKVLIEFQTQTYIKLNSISQINKQKNSKSKQKNDNVTECYK